MAIQIIDLEKDLHENIPIKELAQNDIEFAREIYAALCNNDWYKDGKEWSCSWRYAGEVVAGIRYQGEMYLDFYCSGNEGVVSDRVRDQLGALGWTHKEMKGSSGL